MIAKKVKSQRKPTKSILYPDEQEQPHFNADQPTLHDRNLKQEVLVDREVITVVEQAHPQEHTSHPDPKTPPPTHIRQNSGEFRALGCQIATALAIHNFPEGLAIFTATLTSSKIGTLFAIALALHKIPEGMMIVLPIYYATGSRWKSFSISAGIGIVVQLLGALLGYLLFVTYWNQAISASLLALAAGILLYTVVGGMIPMARRYDPQDRFVTIWIFLGLWFFALVAASFNYI
ncbi:hypothetical protein K493DRAFT_411649 [Basidiobolus meristosporus CBS 931.73]|uniref:Zinc/iron permease n=1 Tax=Basidiobolus meristosporus CBS 931.73 TaxID=1314790 RepID=A0A1Y1XD56_9FUNG|nr:hypothetical protein K493DRAFT_411649 [Basidiobolus meristosporus CBS 931.73]|eukprot:ORX83647.1 hypothetical protein K493DRAFT_411649 [Basidiobolus meristosporus CBS 931.73]